MIAVVAADGETFVSALAHTRQCAANLARIAVEPAAHILTEITSEGCATADDRAGNAVSRFRDRFEVVRLKDGIFLDCIQRGHRTDSDCAVFFFDVCGIRNIAQRNDRLRILKQQFIFEHTQKIRTACHDSRFTWML